MARIEKVSAPPKGGRWKIVLDQTEGASLAEILLWASGSVRGSMWWDRTEFRDRKKPYARAASTRQVHFGDTSPELTFWFSKKADAALFSLFWKKW